MKILSDADVTRIAQLADRHGKMSQQECEDFIRAIETNIVSKIKDARALLDLFKGI